jgi:hypothetical protein
LTLQEFSNLCGLILGVTLLTSKIFNANYMIWIYPIYMMNLASRKWKAPLFYLSSILVFKIIGWSQLSVFSMGLPITILVLLKNCLAFGLVISLYSARLGVEASQRSGN